MANTNPLDAAPETALDALLGLPEHLRGQTKYEEMYTEVTERLRQEAAGLPMNTLQQVLIERIASTYVTIRWREDSNTWKGVTQQRELNTYWLDLTKEFNKQLHAGETALRDNLLMQVHSIIRKGLDEVDDVDTRRTLHRLYTEEFSQLGI